MRLFHVSENPDIRIFEPRQCDLRDDISFPAVRAVDEEHLSDYLTPRDCPRVGWHKNINTSSDDIDRFFSAPSVSHGLAVEPGWFGVMRDAVLWIYEFEPSGFEKSDAGGGLYITGEPASPLSKVCVTDIFDELFRRGVEVRITEDLWPLAESLKYSTLDSAFCRMENANPKKGDPRVEYFL